MNSPLQTEPVPNTTSPATTPFKILSRPEPPPAPTDTPPAVGPIPKLRKLTRNGKIARLPKLERELVNNMLRNNTQHSAIVEALGPHHIYVTERNISNWKTRGGYREWCEEQDRAVEKRLLQDNLANYLRTHDAGDIPEVGLQLAATQLAQHFLKPGSQQQLTDDPQSYARTISALCRITGQIHTLQKHRDDTAKELDPKLPPARLKHLAEQDVELTRKFFTAEDIGERAGDPVTPHRNHIPGNHLTTYQPPTKPIQKPPV